MNIKLQMIYWDRAALKRVLLVYYYFSLGSMRLTSDERLTIRKAFPAM